MRLEKQEALNSLARSKDRKAIPRVLDIIKRNNPDHLGQTLWDDQQELSPLDALMELIRTFKSDPEFQISDKPVLVGYMKNQLSEKGKPTVDEKTVSFFLYELDDTKDAFPYFRQQLKDGDTSCFQFIYQNYCYDFVGNEKPKHLIEEKAKPILLEALNMSPEIEIQSANALMKLNNFKNRNDLVDPIINSMNKLIWDQDVDRYVRENAVLVLFSIRDPRSKEEIKKLSKVENNKILKYTITSVLRDWNDPNSK
jgi:hypothetical protein